MYIPKSFEFNQTEAVYDFMESYSFATLITSPDGVPCASHLPMQLDRTRGRNGTLTAHMARANPQWKHFADAEVLALFQGPHGYVSPTWYEDADTVPTWNYAVVHAYGVPSVIDDPARVAALLKEMVHTYEDEREQPWRVDVDSDTVQSLMRAIVAFEIPISRIESKFKLSQNRSQADRSRVIDSLEQAGDDPAMQLARLMQRMLDEES